MLGAIIFVNSLYYVFCLRCLLVGDVEEGAVDGKQVLMTYEESPELAEPGVDALDDPAAFVAAELVRW
jgi:hypothetical protein